jgi:hypothetical protein
MSEESGRKYRQRGYQDDARPAKTASRPAERAPRAPGRPLQDAAGPRTPNLMASHEVFRCARCGNLLSVSVAPDARCSRCGVDLHSCIECASFDTSARFECSHPGVTARVAPKDARNECSVFAPRTTVERQTSTPARPSSARQAFDDLFK